MSPLPGLARALLACLIALPLAALSGAQAFSSAALKASPQRALTVFPWNGLASEKAAYRTMSAGVRQAAGLPGDAGPQTPADGAGALPGSLPSMADLARYAGAATDQAREAIRREPLAPSAYVLLALAETDPARRKALVEGAAQLTRRDPVLQVLVLDERGKAGNYLGAIDTLDEILRVHPERREEFFPVLAKALGQPAAVPGLARLLARPLPWRESFLNFAVADGTALENLAVVRERIVIDDPEFDRKLIAQLAQSGRIASAERIYAKVAVAPTTSKGAGAWKADYPPFDWQLADQPGFRAQAGDTPESLEVDVKPGNGGVIAARMLRNPGGPFAMRLSHEVDPASQTGDLKLAIACQGQAEPFFQSAFTGTQSAFAAERAPACPYLTVSITARSWTGGRPLAANLGPLKVMPGQP